MMTLEEWVTKKLGARATEIVPDGEPSCRITDLATLNKWQSMSSFECIVTSKTKKQAAGTAENLAAAARALGDHRMMYGASIENLSSQPIDPPSENGALWRYVLSFSLTHRTGIDWSTID